MTAPRGQRRRLPRRPRHRPRGHRCGEPRADAPRAAEHGFDVEELHPPFDTQALSALRASAPAAHVVARRSRPTRCSPRATRRRPSPACARRSTSERRSRGSSTTPARSPRSPRSTRTQRTGRSSRAFETAKARSGRLASVGVSREWSARVERHADVHSGVEIEHVALPDALRRLGSGSTGVLAAESVLAGTVAEAPRLAGRRRLVATGYLSPSGPGLFAPAEGTASDHAGQGVADPSPMLLATALLLGGARPDSGGRRPRGEPHRGAPRHAQAVRHRATGVSATTREFVDTVLGLLPSSRRDTEFALGVGR